MLTTEFATETYDSPVQSDVLSRLEPLPEDRDPLVHCDRFARLDGMVLFSPEFGGLSAGAQKVYLFISFYANHETRSWCLSIRSLMQDTGYSRNHITRVLTELVEAGLISRRAQFVRMENGKMRRVANVYTLLDPKSAKSPDQLGLFGSPRERLNFQDVSEVGNGQGSEPIQQGVYAAPANERGPDSSRGAPDPGAEPGSGQDREAGLPGLFENHGFEDVLADSAGSRLDEVDAPSSSSNIEEPDGVPEVSNRAKLEPLVEFVVEEAIGDPSSGRQLTPELPRRAASPPPPSELRGYIQTTL